MKEFLIFQIKTNSAIIQNFRAQYMSLSSLRRGTYVNSYGVEDTHSMSTCIRIHIPRRIVKAKQTKSNSKNYKRVRLAFEKLSFILTNKFSY